MQYTKLNWRNGQPYSEMFDDIYYSSEDGTVLNKDISTDIDTAINADINTGSNRGTNDSVVSVKPRSDQEISGEAEFKHVFFKHNGLPERFLEKKNFVIAELGFGSGLNCLLTIREWLKHTKDNHDNRGLHSNSIHTQCLHYIAIEKYPLSPETINTLVSQYPELDNYRAELVDTYPPAVAGSHTRYLFDNRVMIHYKFMDAYEALQGESYDVDVWYLDGFSPAKNADMWSSKLFEKIAQNSHHRTTCCTYTAAGFVKRNLQSAGFDVKKVTGFGKKRDMLVAQMNKPEQPQLQHQSQQHGFVEKPWFTSPKKPTYTRRCATIIGAGIAGLSVAYSLVKRGWSVTIIDSFGKPASATSSNPAAIVYPRLSVNNDIDTQLNTQAYSYALYLLKTLQKKHHQRFWFDTGLLQLMDKKRFSEIINKFDFNEDFVKQTEKFETNKEQSEICIEYKGAGVVLPRLLCDVLVKECAEHLTIIKETVRSITRNNKLWQCHFEGHTDDHAADYSDNHLGDSPDINSGIKSSINSDDNLIHESEILVIASGNKLNNLSPEYDFPIESVRGQALVLSESDQSKSITKAMNSNVYFTPLINGKHYLGATYSRNDNNADVDDTDNVELLAGLNKLYPGAFSGEGITDSWVGFRAISKDRVPIVGAVANQKFYQREYTDINHGKKDKSYKSAEHLNGLYISAAHGSRGFTTSFLCAELIASQIDGSPSAVSKSIADYLNPSRFIVNDLKRR